MWTAEPTCPHPSSWALGLSVEGWVRIWGQILHSPDVSDFGLFEQGMLRSWCLEHDTEGGLGFLVAMDSSGLGLRMVLIVYRIGMSTLL